MADNDLIRRGDALAAVHEANSLELAQHGESRIAERIAALPAVTVGVNGSAIHRAVLDWIRDDAGTAVRMSVTPDQANSLTGRILAALEPVTPATDDEDSYPYDGLEQGERDLDGVEDEPVVNEKLRTMYREYLQAIAEGRLVTDAVSPAVTQPAPDAAAIREAWERAYWRLRSYAVHDGDCKLNKPPRFDGPCSCGLTAALEEALALITEKPHDR